MVRVRPLVLVLSLVAALPPTARGQAPDGGVEGGADACAVEPDAGGPVEADAGPRSPAVRALLAVAAQVRDLLRGELDAAVEPAGLFEVPLDDEDAVRVEAARLRAVLERDWGGRRAVLDAGEGDAGEGDGGAAGELDAAPRADRAPRRAPAADARPGPAAAADAGEAQSAPEGGLDAGVARDDAPPPEDLLAARLALDRARLTFLELPVAARRELLAAHEEKRHGDTAAQAASALGDTQRRAAEAEADRRAALEAARRARTETARLLSEERARLSGIARSQAEVEGELVRERELLRERAARTVALRARVRRVLGEVVAAGADARIDALYASLRAEALRPARAALDAALAALDDPRRVPAPGADRLAQLPSSAEREAIGRRRAALGAAARQLAAADRALRFERVEQLFAEVEALNGDRLALLPHLSPARRAEVTGFGTAGIEQAGQELWQLTLLARYRVSWVGRWLRQESGGDLGATALATFFVLLKLALPAIAFVWWRRRAGALLVAARERARDGAGLRWGPFQAGRAIDGLLGLLERVRVPLEWWLLLWLLVWLLPAGASGVLEVGLATTIAGWMLGGLVVVNAIDHLAGKQARGVDRQESGVLRLRSLLLVGRVVVGFGLVLSLTGRLVGQGTVYAWVFTFCWFSALPVAIVLVRWWRTTIFARIERKRRKSAVEQWLLGYRDGWRSFVTALVGAIVLMGAAVSRLARAWVGGLHLTRRLLAYLFRRGMTKKASADADGASRPLEPEERALLGPGSRSAEIVPSAADADVARVVERIDARGGGVFAVVGERGAGKSAIVERIARTAKDVTVLRCPFGGMAGFAPAFLEVLGASADARLEDAAALLDADDRDAALVVDDAHRLILPTMGGLRAFDRVLELARRHSRYAAWVFVLDEVVWRFLASARGVTPTFDAVIQLQPWSEEALGRLIAARNAQAGISPTFERLLTDLPADADEVERAEALRAMEASYYRLIWDYASGNPGVALHVWQSLLARDAEAQVHVRLFRAPEAADLESLSDQPLFVLRAVVQLERPSAEEVRKATNLPRATVEDALRYATAREWLEADADGRYAVTWSWFRVITRVLQRRRLLLSA